MLKNIKEKVLLICSIIVLLMIVIVVFSDKEQPSYKKPTVDKENIMKLMDNIKDNYTLSIEENINNTIKKYMYYNDSVMEVYENESNGYIKYNNDIFNIENNEDDTYKLNKIDKIEFINDEYYNINFLKNIINKCEFEVNNRYSVNCKLKRSDYYNEYNKIYNTNFGNEGNETIDISIVYGSRIQSIKIDYTFNNDIKVYYLEFINIGKTDFSDIREYYKDIFK